MHELALRPKEIFLESPSDKTAAPSAVLFHGITGSPAEMLDLAYALNDKGFNAFVPRLSGHEDGIQSLKKNPATNWLDDVERSFAVISKAAPLGPVYPIGLSFGALLALWAAIRFPERIHRAALLSPPLALKPSTNEYLLRILSYLPDTILNVLGTVDKKHRPQAQFIRDREALDQHSLAGASRVVQIRRRVLANARHIKAPILLLQDPEDHHLSPRGPEILTEALAHAPIRTVWIHGGLHELSIGPRHKEVFQEIENFWLSDSTGK